MEYKDLQEINQKLKTTDIKGKDYIEVNERIKAFRMLFPNGRILTTMIQNENGICVFRAEIFDEEGKVLSSGHAYEKENSTFINKTSYIENCETSAVGRALGMLGIGIDTSVASFEEVANAIQQQEEDKKIDKIKQESLKKAIENNMLDVSGKDKEILNKYGYKEVSEIKLKDYMNIVNDFRKITEG